MGRYVILGFLAICYSVTPVEYDAEIWQKNYFLHFGLIFSQEMRIFLILKLSLELENKFAPVF